MIWKSVSRITVSELLARVVFAVLAAILGSLGVRFSSPLLSCLAALALMILIYRLRYRRF
jgi:hypothetical protein